MYILRHKTRLVNFLHLDICSESYVLVGTVDNLIAGLRYVSHMVAANGSMHTRMLQVTYLMIFQVSNDVNLKPRDKS